jgi:hypothetical protein
MMEGRARMGLSMLNEKKSSRRRESKISQRARRTIKRWLKRRKLTSPTERVVSKAELIRKTAMHSPLSKRKRPQFLP